MPGLRRPTPERGILDLTRRLAEEYEAVPLPEISRVVQEAVAAATGPSGMWGGTREGIPAFVEVVEVLAREDLELGNSAKLPENEGPKRLDLRREAHARVSRSSTPGSSPV
jgi:hypothetical protein